jgi:hypothetical protein
LRFAILGDDLDVMMLGVDAFQNPMALVILSQPETVPKGRDLVWVQDDRSINFFLAVRGALPETLRIRMLNNLYCRGVVQGVE